MSAKRSNFVKFNHKRSKGKTQRGLRHGSFTPLEVERSKGLSTLSVGKVVKSKSAAGMVQSKKIPDTSGYKSNLLNFCHGNQHSTNKLNFGKTDLKSYLPVRKEQTIIAETQSSDDFIDTSQKEKPSHKILEDRSSSKCLIKDVDLKSHANNEPIIIPETQYSDDATDFSQEEEKSNSSLEDRDWPKSLIQLNYRLGIAADTDLDQDFQMSDVIPCTYNVIEKKESGVAGKASKVLEKSNYLEAAEFQTSKPSIEKPTVLAYANTKVLDANDDALKDSIIAKLNESKYKPEKKEKEKLAGLCVKMRHEVLPQHQVESTAGTRSMNGDETARFKEYTVLKNGPFDNSEDAKIKKNWQTFCKDNGWDPEKPEAFLLMRHNKTFLMHNVENRRNFVRCLAHGLTDRSLYSVNYRFRNLFGNSNNNTNRYDEVDDRRIWQYLSAYPDLKADKGVDHQYADLAKILDRTRSSVWRRVQLLKKKADQAETRRSPASMSRVEN